MNILDKIVSNTKNEIIKRKNTIPLESFIDHLIPSQRNFKKAIAEVNNLPNLIAEIKKASPSAGVIRKNFNPVEIAKIYEKQATAISVLTNEKFFQGKLEYLRAVSKVTTIPLLRKDFIIDEYQIYEARLYEADAILLITSILTKSEINRFITLAKSLKMDCLVEIHSETELKKVLETTAEIIGINNRNLTTFETNLDTSLKLSPIIKNRKPKKIIVAESGIKDRQDLEILRGKVEAVLIGSSLMKASDIKNNLLKLY